MTREKHSTQTMSNLSMSLIESAFLLLAQRSLPVYQRNIDRQRPPVARPENANAAAAIVMLVTGLDHHLCRLKYLRDVAEHDPPLPYTPYFNWNFGDGLPKKVQRLLTRPKEQRLLTQIVEMTVCRDLIVHPTFYTVTHWWNADKPLKAKLAHGAIFRGKVLKNKMQRKELTSLLRLPLVPTWVSYVDAVVCILVLHRLLNLLEWRYGSTYASVGGITAYENQTKNLFIGWNWQQTHPREIEDWVKAFFNSLSSKDQNTIKKRLGGNVKLYIHTKRRKLRFRPTKKKQSLERFFSHRNEWKPDFLSKPPPSSHEGHQPQ